MIDLKTLEHELHHARLARLDAQAAGCEVEELIWTVQHFQPGKQRLLFMVDGLDPLESDAPAH
jgi:hypothetical protein